MPFEETDAVPLGEPFASAGLEALHVAGVELGRCVSHPCPLRFYPLVGIIGVKKTPPQCCDGVFSAEAF
jgi:hypothetical protein